MVFQGPEDCRGAGGRRCARGRLSWRFQENERLVSRSAEKGEGWRVSEIGQGARARARLDPDFRGIPVERAACV